MFVRVRAPHRGLTAGGVTQVVSPRLRPRRAGPIDAHRLRHTAATEMLRAGASLTEIGQVLRHRRPLTTAIYAKVDRDALRRSRGRGRERCAMSALRAAARPTTWRCAARWASSSARDEKLLTEFIAWLDEHGATTITDADGARVGDAADGAQRELARPPAAVVRGFAALPARARPGARGAARPAAARPRPRGALPLLATPRSRALMAAADGVCDAARARRPTRR